MIWSWYQPRKCCWGQNKAKLSSTKTPQTTLTPTHSTPTDHEIIWNHVLSLEGYLKCPVMRCFKGTLRHRGEGRTSHCRWARELLCLIGVELGRVGNIMHNVWRLPVSPLCIIVWHKKYCTWIRMYIYFLYICIYIYSMCFGKWPGHVESKNCLSFLHLWCLRCEWRQWQWRHSKIPLFSPQKHLAELPTIQLACFHRSNAIFLVRLLACPSTKVITKHTKNGIQSTGACCMKGSPLLPCSKGMARIDDHRSMTMNTFFLILSKSKELCALESSYHHSCLERLQDYVYITFLPAHRDIVGHSAWLPVCITV